MFLQYFKVSVEGNPELNSFGFALQRSVIGL